MCYVDKDVNDSEEALQEIAKKLELVKPEGCIFTADSAASGIVGQAADQDGLLRASKILEY